MKRQIITIAIMFLCLVLLGGQVQANDDRVASVWQRMLEQEEQPLSFVQTMITVFPKRTAITVDQVTRFSPYRWFLRRSSDQHGPLSFRSDQDGFRALAEEEGFSFHDPYSRPLREILHPTLQRDTTNLRFVDRTILRGIDTIALERVVRGKGVIRYWIDAKRHLLLKEESLDERGQVIYVLLRESFEELKEGTEGGEIPGNWNFEDPRLKHFGDERDWWQDVLLVGLSKQDRTALVPRYLPPEAHLVAAFREQDGTIILRYFDGRRVFSIFEQAGSGVRENYVRSEPYAVFTTTRYGMVVTIVGPLMRQEMEKIADSLENLNEGDFVD